ncbi:MAG: hypothetical protein R3C68_18165 [Myxococcota bacterium]
MDWASTAAFVLDDPGMEYLSLPIWMPLTLCNKRYAEIHGLGSPLLPDAERAEVGFDRRLVGIDRQRHEVLLHDVGAPMLDDASERIRARSR